jgi:uncharacterized tellurite resistance protein B-like protein
MLRSIQRFYTELIQPRQDPDGITSREATDRALRLATAALLIETTRADRTVADEEREAVTDALKGTFGLSEQETAELVSLAEAQAAEAVSLYEFTYLIDKGFDPAQKREVVALLWRVVFADARLEAHEEALVRRVAELIHVPHKDFIDTKLEARDAADGHD